MNISSFNNPQWRVRKLERFLFKIFRYRGTQNINENLQFFLFIQGFVESRLEKIIQLENDDDRRMFNHIFDSELLAKNNLNKELLRENLESNIKYKQSGDALVKHIDAPCTHCYAELHNISNHYGVNYVIAVTTLANYFFKMSLNFSDIEKCFVNNIDIKSVSLDEKNVCSGLYASLHDNERTILGHPLDLKVHYCQYRICKVLAGKENAEAACSFNSIIPLTTTKLFNEEIIVKNRNIPIFILNSVVEAHELQYDSLLLTHRKIILQMKKHFKAILSAKCDNSKIDNIMVELDKRYRDSQLSNEFYSARISWASFWGGVKALEYMDLSPLKKRDVYWVYHEKGDVDIFIERFLRIYALISKANLKLRDLQFVHVPEINDPVNRGNSKIKIWSPEELLLAAFDNNIECPKELRERQAKILEKKRNKDSAEEYLLYPAIRKKSLMLLTAPAKHGKSYLAMALSYAIAKKGQVFSDWVVKRSSKVLYVIDREVDTCERQKRENLFNKIYPSGKKSKSVTFEPVSNFNIYDEKCRKEIEDMLIDAQLASDPKGEPVQLLVIDHLTKMIQGKLTAASWDSLRPWLDHLMNDIGVAILILHHSNKSGDVYGTSFSVNDLNIRIHLEKTSTMDENILKLNLTVPENRHGASIDEPIAVSFNLGSRPSITSDQDSQVESLWTSLKANKEDSSTAEERRAITTKRRIEKFVEMKISDPELTMKQIADKFGIGLKSIEGLAVKHGLTNERWKDLDIED